MNLAKLRREYKEANHLEAKVYIILEAVRSRITITVNLFSDKKDGFEKTRGI